MKLFKKIFLLFLLTSCANIIPPTGGKKDSTAPKILNISSAHSSQQNATTIKFDFDEFIQLNEWENYFYISPPIKKQVEKKIKGQALYITINEVLNKNATYYFGLNSCVKDNNEGNVLDSLSYVFSTNEQFDSLTLNGSLHDAYNLNPMKNCWVMLYNEDVNDSLIFKVAPNYVAKTDKKGMFYFPNLKDKNYKAVSLSDFDFVYDQTEKIAFMNSLVSAKNDSFISLYAFDPINKIDSSTNTLEKYTPYSPDSSVIDSIIKKDTIAKGKLKVISNQKSTCILQLLQGQKVIQELYFTKSPYIIDGINPGNYQLKSITDSNQDSVWNTGSWGNKIQPEKVVYYPSEITIRSNWDLELEWIIEE